jgi:flagellar operon protein
MSSIDLLHGLGGLSPIPPKKQGDDPVIPAGDDFSSQLDALIGHKPAIAEPQKVGTTEAETSEVQSGPDLTFSRHANARLESRGITLDTAQLTKLDDAVTRLADKGAKESLVLLDEHAFVVGVPRRTVITAMTRNEAMGNIFTQIDSTLVIS